MPRKLVVSSAAALCVMGILGTPALAAASTPPAAPTGLHVVNAGGNWIRFGVRAAAHATGYRVYASTTKANLYVDNIARAYHSSVSRNPQSIPLYHLPRTSRPYYYRVAALAGSRRVFSAAIPAAGVQPSTPTSLRAVSNPVGTPDPGTHLAWQHGFASRFIVERSSSSSMSNASRSYVSGVQSRFSPYGLTTGRTYYFRVQAYNYGARSGWSRTASVRAVTRTQGVRVATYNLLQLTSDGSRYSNDRQAETISAWSQRSSRAAALVSSTSPDALAIEEGGYYTQGAPTRGSVRQVDELVTRTDALGHDYAVAPTEDYTPAKGLKNVHFTYVVYNRATLQVVRSDGGAGDATSPANCRCGVIELDSPVARRAAWAVLRNRSTGAQFVFVAVHLANATINNGRSDAVRRAESRLLLGRIASINTRNLPVVYSGDFNSDRRNDVPGPVLRPTLDEASAVAHTTFNAAYDSYNDYHRRPPAYSLDIDRIFVSPGVGVASWGKVLQLSHGRFVGAIPSDHNPVAAYVYLPY